MNGNAKFWISMVVFQAIFGLVVFTATRQYYLDDAIHSPGKVSAVPMASSQPSPARPQPAKGTSPTAAVPVFPGDVTQEDPEAMARQADDYFTNQQFEEAAELYGRMLVMGSGGVDTYNNLGITLHYLGRSDEALSVLDEGVEVDSTYQRIWLTMGYVNSQIGHTEKARAALTTAVSLDADSDVGRSAAKMLESLP